MTRGVWAIVRCRRSSLEAALDSAAFSAFNLAAVTCCSYLRILSSATTSRAR